MVMTKAVSEMAINRIRDLKDMGMSDTEAFEVMMNFHDVVYDNAPVVEDTPRKIAFWATLRPVVKMSGTDDMSELKSYDSLYRKTPGWIRTYRSILDNPMWLAEKFTKGQAWLDLLLMAAYEDCFVISNKKKVTLRRGQLCMSTRNLAGRWKWSRNKVFRFLETLRAEGMATVSGGNGRNHPTEPPSAPPMEHETELPKNFVTTIISITNYDKYQGGETTHEKEKKQRTEPGGGAALYNKEDIEEDNNNNNTTCSTIAYSESNNSSCNTTCSTSELLSSSYACRQPAKNETGKGLPTCKGDGEQLSGGNAGGSIPVKAENPGGTVRTESTQKTGEADKPVTTLPAVTPKADKAKPGPKDAGIVVETMMAFFNSEVDRCGSQIPRIRVMTPKRAKAVKAIVKQFGEQTVRETLAKALRNEYLNGNSSSGWKADFDWIIKPDKFLKIHEGAYDYNRKNSGKNSLEQKVRDYEREIQQAGGDGMYGPIIPPRRK